MTIKNWNTFNEAKTQEEFDKEEQEQIELRDLVFRSDVNELANRLKRHKDHTSYLYQMLLKHSVKHGRLEIVKFFHEKGVVYTDRPKLVIVAFEYKHLDVVEWLIDNRYNEDFTKVMDWIGILNKLNTEEKKHYLNMCQKWLDDGVVTPSKLVNKKDIGRFEKVPYEDIVKEYGSYMEFVKSQNAELN